MTTTAPLAPTQISQLFQETPTTKGVSGATTLSLELGSVAESATTSVSSEGANYAYLLFPISLPANATVASATLKFTLSRAWAAAGKSVDLHAITASWSPSVITWKTRPPVRTSDPMTRSFASSAVESVITIDVTDHIAKAASGTPWFGWQMRSTDTNSEKIYGKGTKQPTLTIEYYTGHKKPTNPRPGSGTETVQVASAQPDLQLDTNIFMGGYTSQAMRVQLSNSSARNASGAFTTPVWSSPEVSDTDGVLVLSSLSGAPTASSGSGYWWIGALQGTDGKWSPWSDPVKYIYRSHGSLTITNPAASPLNYVEDATPPLAWTFTGRTQTKYQYVIYDQATSLPLVTSPVVVDTDSTITPPTDIVTQTNKNYVLEIRIWDEYTTQRQPVTENYVTKPAFVSAQRTFTYQLNASVTPVANLVLTNYNPKPIVRLAWTRATEPDSFEIVRNGIVIATNLTGADANKSGTAYYWQDYFPPPTIPLTYEVRAKVNNVTSSANPTAQTVNTSALAWLADIEDDLFIAISGETPVEPILTEVGTTHQPLNSEFGVRIVSSLHGYSGSVAGGLCGECVGDGTTSEELQQQLLTLRDQPGKRLYLSIGNIAVPVVIFDVTTGPRYGPAFGNLYGVAFNWHEVA
jgi:hypothetical protein